jgi:acylphosphatase
MSTSTRTRVIYRGQVQGVGFRATVFRLAGRYAVTGLVRNLNDGSVELIVEGEPGPQRRLIDEIAREMHEYIDHAHEGQAPATDEFSAFSIAR